LSTLDCTKPPEPIVPPRQPDENSIQAMAMSRCGSLLMMSGSTQQMLSGGVTIATLARMLGGAAGRPVVDRTALDGTYAVSVKFAREGAMITPGGVQAPATPTPTDEVPSLFTAVQEQLGLKLEAATVQTQVLVIDHLERPTEN
jgi:uncharacterized protein (TIGR03435 family)